METCDVTNGSVGSHVMNVHGRLFILAFVALGACKDETSTAPDAAASAKASASSSMAVVDAPTRTKWWDVAKKSKVYTDERRVDADNAVHMLPQPMREQVRHALDDMAQQDATGDGIRDASQIARDAQARVDDAHNQAGVQAITRAGLVVLHGLIAQACIDHNDAASLAPVIAAIREMPLPRLDKGDGRSERGVLEQEMRAAVDDKTMKAILASAPPPKKSL
jgi:hypothetical protein